MAVKIVRVGYSPASIGGTGGSTTAARYIKSFNSTSDWTLLGDDYTITVAESTHGKGTSPEVHTYLDNGTLEEVEVAVIINGSGDVTIAVTASPDNRFQGKLIIL